MMPVCIGNEQDGAIYCSDDGAETWVKKSLPAETNCPTSLLIDPANPDKLVLSAWGRSVKNQLSSCIGGGIYISEDGGKTWKPTLQKDQYIFDLTNKNHPQTSIAYFRVYWYFVEPEPGQYNWSMINKALRTAAERGQTLMHQLLPGQTYG